LVNRFLATSRMCAESSESSKILAMVTAPIMDESVNIGKRVAVAHGI
jgi:hypothetical protein